MVPDTLYWDADATPFPPDSNPVNADADIQPLVQAINATGWMKTVQSCAGHPERDKPAYAAPEVWVLLANPADLPHFYQWVERATRLRQERSPIKAPDRLIDVYFLGWYRYGLYFSVCGRYIDPFENELIRDVLREALQG